LFQVLFNFLGLTLYNAFPDGVQLKGSPLLAPFICVRVVTRGDFAQLVRRNVARNLKRCAAAGLENFMIEVRNISFLVLVFDSCLIPQTVFESVLKLRWTSCYDFLPWSHCQLVDKILLYKH